jgi:hypothetical protein
MKKSEFTEELRKMCRPYPVTFDDPFVQSYWEVLEGQPYLPKAMFNVRKLPGNRNPSPGDILAECKNLSRIHGMPVIIDSSIAPWTERGSQKLAQIGQLFKTGQFKKLQEMGAVQR